MSTKPVITVSIGQVPEILDIHWSTKNVVFLLGPPGIGKSDVVRQFARKKAKELKREYIEWFDVVGSGKEKEILENPSKYFVLVDLKLYEYEPQDIKGIMYIDEKNEKTIIIPWDWAKYFMLENSAGILFLDELNMASPDVLKVAFQLVYQRVIANRRIKGDLLIVAAGNPTEHNYLATSLPDPLIDRMGIYYVTTDLDAWLKWALKNNIHPYITRFLTIFPQYLYFDKGKEFNRDIRITTPRSWAMLSKIIKELEKRKLPKDEFYIMLRDLSSGYLHPEVHAKFTGFVRTLLYQNIYEIEEYINNPLKLTQDEMTKKNIETLYLISSLVTSKYLNNEIHPEKFMRYLNTVANIYSEVALAMLIELIEKIKSRYKGNKAEEEISKILDILRDNLPSLYESLIRIFSD